MNDPLFDLFGVKLGSVVAGFIGGLVRSLIMRNATVSQTIIACIVGGATAGYFTPVAMHWLPYELTAASLEGAVGYAIGISGTVICEGVINLARRWRENPTLPQDTK